MSERQRKYRESTGNYSRSDPILRWLSRDRVPTDYRERQLRITGYFYSNDWRTWSNQFNFTITWFSYRVAITAASVTAFGFGVHQLFTKLMRM